MSSMERLTHTAAPASVLLIRVMVGVVFLTEGIQKFLYPNELGVGRFLKIGIPAAEAWRRLWASLKSSVAPC